MNDLRGGGYGSGRPARFYRDKLNGKIMGVCAGIADYTGVGVVWVRLAMLFAILSTGVALPAYFVIGLLADRKPAHLYDEGREPPFRQAPRQSPADIAQAVRTQFRDLDHRLAEVEHYYVSANPRLAAEIERLR